MNRTNNSDDILQRLQLLGLGRDESMLYTELLKGPTTHLQLAHATGINRTKIYRLAEDLAKRSLVTRRSDDRGTFLVAADPVTLEVNLVAREEKVKAQRVAFDSVLPLLTGLQQGDASTFIVQTYDGEEGFKQMLWHELKTKGQNLIFGGGTIEELVPNRAWAEKHRALTTQTDYTVRELLNPDGDNQPFTLNQEFLDKHYRARYIDPAVLRMEQQIAIYNDTVAIYNWRDSQKVGVEIINTALASTMRQLFERYWELAEEQPSAAVL